MKKNYFSKNKFNRCLSLLLLSALVLTGCGTSVTEDITDDIKEKLVDDTPTVSFKETDALSYITDYSVSFSDNKKSLVYQCSFAEDKIPATDDNLLYLFGFECYEDTSDFSGTPLCREKLKKNVTLKVDFTQALLFKEYVPAIKIDGKFYALETPKYATNPETLAENTSEPVETKSKKGLLIDVTTINSGLLSDLNLSHGVYNMPLSFFLGSKDSDEPLIEYEYEGKTYYFKQSSVDVYDLIIESLTDQGICVTCVVLNNWTDTYQELIHPLSRNKTKDSYYYAFNTEEEEGVKLIEACALFLAERYSSGEHGLVSNWVIANEINQHSTWNYMDTDDLDYYMESFEHAFRIFYNAAKSTYKNADVYFSIDHDWNDNDGDNSLFFNGKDVIETFNSYAKAGGDYDWSIAIHPYPVPMTKVNYWSDTHDMSVDAAELTIMNLSTITDLIFQPDFLNPAGNVRNLAVTELGYTSKSGEKLQAVAFAYCYKIIEQNDYIKLFLLNRETDATAEMKNGLFLGLYSLDYTPKYIKEVFCDIDGEDKDKYNEIILNILDANSIEEALSWAGE